MRPVLQTSQISALIRVKGGSRPILHGVFGGTNGEPEEVLNGQEKCRHSSLQAGGRRGSCLACSPRRSFLETTRSRGVVASQGRIRGQEKSPKPPPVASSRRRPATRRKASCIRSASLSNVVERSLPPSPTLATSTQRPFSAIHLIWNGHRAAVEHSIISGGRPRRMVHGAGSSRKDRHRPTTFPRSAGAAPRRACH